MSSLVITAGTVTTIEDRVGELRTLADALAAAGHFRASEDLARAAASAGRAARTLGRRLRHDRDAMAAGGLG